MPRNRNAEPLDDVNRLLMGGGKVPSAFLKKHPVGTVFEGEILELGTSQQTDVQTGKVKTYDNGDPRMQVVITIQTDEDDEPNEDGEDDGRRRIYAYWKMLDAIRDAVKAAGEDKLLVGGWLSVEFSGVEKPKARGMNGAKLFTAEYEAPDVMAQAAGPDDDEDEDEEEPPPRKRTAKKAAPAKAASTRKRRAPEPEDNDEDDDEEPPPPRKRAAKKAPAKRTRAKADVDAYTDDDEDGEESF